MGDDAKYVPGAAEQAFLAAIENPRYDRGMVNGLEVFLEGREPEDMQGFYSREELDALASLKGSERDVEARMPVKMTRHYYQLARNSEPLQRVVKEGPAQKQHHGTHDK